MEKTSVVNRRKFMAQAGTAAAVVAAAPHVARAVDLSADPVRIAHIGLGTRGWDLIRYTGMIDTAKVVGVCDVYKAHRERGAEASQNPDVKKYVDYHDVLEDPKVEAVVIAAPDHWHEQMVLDALHAGKDVYCEKGWSISIAAAKRMRDAVRKTGRVLQLGHQGRQYPASVDGGDRIRNGELGALTWVKTGRYTNNPADKPIWRWYGHYGIFDRPDPVQVAKDVDWEKWLGDCPKIDFDERHFWHWRCYWRYGTGQAGDLLSHELDYVQSVLKYGIPDTCMCSGLNAFWQDDREIPDTWLANYQFEKQKCSVSFEGIMNSKRIQPPEFCGRDKRMIYNGIGQDAKMYQIFDDGPPYRMGEATQPEPLVTYDTKSAPRWTSHMENFLECVRTREKTRCNEDEAFVETATLLMSVESFHKKRQVRWDPEREEIV